MQLSMKSGAPLWRLSAAVSLALVLSAVPRPMVLAAATSCFTDPLGDTAGQSGGAGVDARADLIEMCVSYGVRTLIVSAAVAEPTDPTVDTQWESDYSEMRWPVWTEEYWGQSPTMAIVFDRGSDDGLEAHVRDGFSGQPVCPAVAEFDGSTYSARVDTSCVGGPDSIWVTAVVTYATGAAGTSDHVWDELAGPEQVARDAASTRSSGRLAGPTRFDTAVAIARYQFPQQADGVYLATAGNYPDALAGGVLSGGPILLVPQCGNLPEVVSGAISDLNPLWVTALGGPAAICDEILEQAAGDAVASRLHGESRIGTAVAIAGHLYPPPQKPEVVYLARADNYPDALAGGSLTRGPILLVPQCGDVPEPVAGLLAFLVPAEVIALGGSSAICDVLLEDAAGEAHSSRLAGPDRISTAVAISEHQFPNGAAEVYLARSDNYPDALAGGALKSGPILLVPSCGALPAVVAAEIQRLDPGKVLALGGTAAVCEQILAEAAAA